MLKLSWLISLGISLLGFLIIENFFTIKPEGVSGNGNLGAVGMALVLPFLLLSLLTTFRYFLTVSKQASDRLVKVISFIGGFALIGVLLYFAIDYKNNVLESLGGPVSNPDSKIYGYPILNQYTNRVYYNFYTFALIHSISGLVGAIVGILNTEKKKEELPM